MKAVILLAVVIFTSMQASARLNTVDLTCAEVQSAILKKGKLVMSTGADGLFETFNSKNKLCAPPSYEVDAYAKTRDEEKCHVGYYCRSRGAASVVTLFPRIAPSKVLPCHEGTRLMDQVQSGYHDRLDSLVLTCVKGRFIPLP